ncbi:hypothetical protein HF995_03015 [Sanguibacter hominis ATCC BAA-789]|uniref:TadE-like protein n=1 Tax=Sanguibacter hominis ATCC BAA-789 TaxID=1312740 RepID=A0A9X5FE74_9MICO|nr:hypothetical protein [Sanguibacter hominis]NKX92251.1 hypothetical protein [Sanguibacter hominis ATCC BAA-789]
MEAAFIYPVVFAVLALLLYVGDMFYQRSWIEAAVMRYSIEGAAEVANSSLANVSVDNGSGAGSLDVGGIENNPYRFLFNGGADSDVAASAAANEAALKAEVADGRASFFGLAPNLRALGVDYRSSLVYGDYVVSADYGFQLPVASFIVPSGRIGLDFASESTSNVTSMGEFVRNVEILDDLRAEFDDEVSAVTGLAVEIERFRSYVENIG